MFHYVQHDVLQPYPHYYFGENMKIIYAGTPEFAVEPLKKILQMHNIQVVGVVTQEDKPQGRKGILTPPPVKVEAEKYNIPVLQYPKIKERVADLRALGADMMVTCAYGQILTQEVLDCFPKGVYNIHAGLLPKYRGASPIQSCILAGETQTGVTIIKTERGLDTGDILRMQTLDILQSETYGQLSERLSLLGAELIVTAIEEVRNGTATLTPQGEENVNVVRKITKEQAQIDFSKSAKEIVNLVRAMNPAPVAFTTLENNKINVWEAEKAVLTDEENAYMQKAEIGEILSDKAKRGLLVKCGDGAVKLVKVQPSGGKIMNGGDLINGRKAQKGQVFSC